MVKERSIRTGWLRFMYGYTIAGAGGFGLAILLAPGAVRGAFGMPAQDPVVFGITGSVYLAFGLLSIPGLRAPLRFAPVLLLQLCYKSVWLAGVVAPLFFRGQLPMHAAPIAAIFLTYVIGDIVALPFADLWSDRGGGHGGGMGA